MPQIDILLALGIRGRTTMAAEVGVAVSVVLPLCIPS